MAAMMKLIALKAIEMINENIRKGFSYDGEQFQYSTKPFGMPYNQKSARAMGKPRSQKNPEGLYSVVRSKKRGGKMWMIVFGGYKQFKEKVNPEAKDDFLTWSGRMLRNMKTLEVNEEKMTAQIGFTDPAQTQKAFWFNVSGVGKSRKLWKFLGLSPAQQQELAEFSASAFTSGDIAKILNLPPEI